MSEIDMGLRHKYLNQSSTPCGSVEVEPWGKVYIRSLTLAELASLRGIADEADAIAGLVLVGVCDQHGERVFKDDDGDRLKAVPFGVVKAVADAVGTFNKLNAEAVADAKND